MHTLPGLLHAQWGRGGTLIPTASKTEHAKEGAESHQDPRPLSGHAEEDGPPQGPLSSGEAPGGDESDLIPSCCVPTPLACRSSQQPLGSAKARLWEGAESIPPRGPLEDGRAPAPAAAVLGQPRPGCSRQPRRAQLTLHCQQPQPGPALSPRGGALGEGPVSHPVGALCV